ncbi:hypothetical protein SETIT_1G036200v2 [Setaria italica]|uniref:Uncharacterized protein n=1 Tax=Setaria italica TaxID=4555 RepID=A0A368PGU1_SETIT|nr:hypothetical protein SETIT_1G036200v2 [Setaria italica]
MAMNFAVTCGGLAGDGGQRGHRSSPKKTAFTNRTDYGKGDREAQWATAQRTLHGLNQATTSSHLFGDTNSYRELSELVEQAAKRAEVARLRELHTLKGHIESVVKLKGLDIDTQMKLKRL